MSENSVRDDGLVYRALIEARARIAQCAFEHGGADHVQGSLDLIDRALAKFTIAPTTAAPGPAGARP